MQNQIKDFGIMDLPHLIKVSKIKIVSIKYLFTFKNGISFSNSNVNVAIRITNFVTTNGFDQIANEG